MGNNAGSCISSVTAVCCYSLFPLFSTTNGSGFCAVCVCELPPPAAVTVAEVLVVLMPL